MNAVKWYKKESCQCILLMIFFMFVHIRFKDIFEDGRPPYIFLSMFIGGWMRNHIYKRQDKGFIILPVIMGLNYILFRLGIYIPNDSVLIIGALLWSVYCLKKEKDVHLLFKSVLFIVLILSFFILDHTMYKDHFIKDNNLYRCIKKKCDIDGKITKRDLQPITYLFFSDNHYIRTLEGIENLSNLKTIYISDLNMVHNLKPLNGLKNLESLTIWDGNIDKLKEITKLDNLKRLSIGDIDLDDLHELKRFKHLEKLDLSDERIKSFKGIEYLSSLKELSICGIDLDDLHELKRFKHLEKLDLSDERIKSFKGIEYLSSLKELSIYGIDLDDLHELKGFKHLEKLELSKGRMKNLEGIEYLSSLKELTLYDIGIERIDEVLQLKNLEKIEMRECFILHYDAFIKQAKNYEFDIQIIDSLNE